MTPAQINAALQTLAAVAQAIRLLGEVPSGQLYAQLVGQLSLSDYDAIIRTLKGASLIEETPAHLIRWTGPRT